MSEPRDIADQPDDPRTGSYIHPDYVHANPDRSIPWPAVAVFMLAIGFVAAALIVWDGVNP